MSCVFGISHSANGEGGTQGEVSLAIENQKFGFVYTKFEMLRHPNEEVEWT